MRTLTLHHFFPDRLNLYSDQGNTMILKMRSEWRGIQLDIVPVNSAAEADISEADLFFMGGGSDREQRLCTQELFSIKDNLKAAIDDGISGLVICGGYQLLGNYYELQTGEKLDGLGILDFYSKSNPQSQRMIGNMFIQSKIFGRMTGYENHSGETFHNYDPLGEVLQGFGNTQSGEAEGLLYNHLIGTYLHGPLLSKNPQIADWLISNALERKYGDGFLEPLNDEFSEKANEFLFARSIISSKI